MTTITEPDYGKTFSYYDGSPSSPGGPNLSGTVVYRFASGIARVGKFTTTREMITVTLDDKKKTTQRGGLDRFALAEMLMRELVREEKSWR